MQQAATASSVIGIDVCRVLITGLEIRYLASDGEVLSRSLVHRRGPGRGEPGAGFVQCSAAVPTVSASSFVRILIIDLSADNLLAPNVRFGSIRDLSVCRTM